MPDHIEELFADLRVATLPQVQPPGIDAVRRTTRRRRTTRTAAAAAVALAVTSGLVVAGLPQRGGHRTAPAERVRDLIGTAQRALSSQRPGPAGPPQGGPVTAAGRLTFADQRAGSYTLTLACAGPGQVAVEARVVRGGDSAVLGGSVVSCAAAPRAMVLTFRLPVTGSIVVALAGDAAAAGSAGFALVLDAGDEADGGDGAPAAPESAWNAARAADVLAASGQAGATQVTTEQVHTAMHYTGPGAARPGDYELALVCAGPGTLTVTVRTVSTGGGEITDTGPTVLDRQVACRDEDPRLAETDLLTLPKNFGFVITAVPDNAARNRAGWAYQLSAR